MCINTEQVPPGRPIIFLKSNNLKMAAVSLKRSISTSLSLKSSQFSGTASSMSDIVMSILLTHLIFFGWEGEGEWGGGGRLFEFEWVGEGVGAYSRLSAY